MDTPLGQLGHKPTRLLNIHPPGVEVEVARLKMTVREVLIIGNGLTVRYKLGWWLPDGNHHEGWFDQFEIMDGPDEYVIGFHTLTKD